MKRAIGFYRNEAAFCAKAPALGLDDADMPGVNFGYHHGNVRGEAVSAVVGNNRAFGLGVGLFQRFDLILFHIYRTEYKIHLAGDLLHMGCIQHHHVFCRLGHGGGHGPAAAHSLFIRFACAAARSSQDGQLEPGVVLQQRNKTLTHHTGGADHAHAKILHFSLLLSFPQKHPLFFVFERRIQKKPA